MLNMRTQLTSMFAVLVMSLFGACDESEDQSPEVVQDSDGPEDGASYTASFSDSEMIACQNSEQPCPAPFTEDYFCCPVGGDCTDFDFGGGYPAGDEDACGFVTDTRTNGPLERDEHGCMVTTETTFCEIVAPPDTETSDGETTD
jgi:hypothetical protein